MILNDIKIGYGVWYVSDSCVYRQRISLNQKQFDYIISKIKDELEYIKVTPNYNSYEKLYLDIPKEGKYSNKEFYYNMVTSKFIKNLLSEKLQKRYLLDRNSYFLIKD